MERKCSSIILSLTTICILFSAMGIFVLKKLPLYFGEVNLEQIIFNLSQPMKGAQSDIIVSVLSSVILMFLVQLVIYVIIIYLLNKFTVGKVNIFMKLTGLIACIILIILMCVKIDNKYKIAEYIDMIKNENGFVEKYFVDGHTLTYEKPDTQRNLIYIFSESLESTYLSVEVGGAEKEGLMPNLQVLAENEVAFRTANGHIQGATQVPGTGWTAAGIMAQTSGLPLKVSIGGNEYGEDGVFAPGVYSLGEVLKECGYNNYFRMGSESEFAGRNVYLTTNGEYEIFDYNTAIETGEIPSDYHEWWGYEDQKLFDKAMEDLESISQEDAPFNYMLLTADTHFADGYICPLCQENDGRQYANVISCQDNQIIDFIHWIENQDFYENTTIIISGDHLSMDTTYFDTIDGDIYRTTFFTIVNSVIKDEFNHQRDFTSMDIYPTTLASLGIIVDSDRIGLGTNLYSDTPTLLEEIGYKELETGLSGYSSFYNREILGMN